MGTFHPARLMEGLVNAALDAGRVIMEVYAAPIAVAVKDDLSPGTEADVRAEALILNRLTALAPDIPVVAEEQVAKGLIPPTDGLFFLVDPLDGTREFISRNGEFTVNIALIDKGEPVAGVVYAPALGRIFTGSKAGAFAAGLDADHKPGAFSPIAVRPPPEGGIVVVGSRSHGSAEADHFVRRFQVADYRSAGSSLKFCLLAAGEADLYPRFGRTMEWDTAAGDAVLRAAGGVMWRTDGSPFLYGKRNQPDAGDFANPFFVAASSAALLA